MTIGQRVAVVAVLAVMACVALFGAYNARERREELMADALEEAQATGATLDVVLNEVLAERDLGELAHLPDEIARARRIYGVVILDARRGELIASGTLRGHGHELRNFAASAARDGRATAYDTSIDGERLAAYAFPLRRGHQNVVGAAVVVRDLSHIQHFIERSQRRILGVGVALVLLVVAVVIGVTRVTVTRPVAKLIEGVRRIGEGDLSRPIAVERHDELGRIAAALNKMMDDLLGARDQLRRELEGRFRLEKSIELERKLQHAQRLAAVGQIAASLAHEIGSPLHVIAGRARFAATRDTPAEMRDNLLVIASQADRITGIVEQLLSIGRRRAPRVQPVVLCDVVRSVVALLGPQAAQQSVGLTLMDQAPEGLRTIGDPDALQQVVFNLVMNALQAQPGGGAVDVVVRGAQEHDSLGSARPRIIVEVRDKGPGVPPDARERIFDAFATGREGGGGTGLGLAVVQGIVREHAGTIRVADNPGGGAVFRVSLPAEEEH